MIGTIYKNEQGFSFPPQSKKDYEYAEKCWNCCRGTFSSLNETMAYIIVTFYSPIKQKA